MLTTGVRTPLGIKVLGSDLSEIEKAGSKEMAGTTGLEPAASAVTGQRSNQLNYVPSLFSTGLWETLDFPVFSYCR